MIPQKEAEELIKEKRKDTDREKLTDADVVELMRQASAIVEARAGQKNANRGIELALNKLARHRDNLLEDENTKAKLTLAEMTGKDDDEVEANFMHRAIEVIKSP